MLELEAGAAPRSPSSLELLLSKPLLLQLLLLQTEVRNRSPEVLEKVWRESRIRISGICFLAKSDGVKESLNSSVIHERRSEMTIQIQY